ncbi:MAG TPA: hypothetical protein VK084_04500 [Chitinophagaceae bacterium]|nr:hypothetical protein [Chitinophagaceae bacterium]
MDRFYIILIAIFCGVNGLGIAYSHLLEGWGIDNVAGMVANIILAVLSAALYYLGLKSIKSSNHHAFMRHVYISTFAKLFICAIGILIYAFINKEDLNLGTIILFFVLYLIYTVLETRSLMRVAKTPTKQTKPQNEE